MIRLSSALSTLGVSVLLLTPCIAAQGQNKGTYTAGDPHSGTDQFVLTRPNGQQTTFSRTYQAEVTAAGKAEDLETFLDAAGVPTDRSGPKLTLPEGTTLDLTRDGSKQMGKSVGALFGPGTGEMHFMFEPVGTGFDGLPSVFEASLGFSDVFAGASVMFEELSRPTVDGILTDLFDELFTDLPIAFQPDLHLLLSEDLITFDFPGDATNPFVSNFSSDLSTEAPLVFRLTAVPEPSTIMLLLAGFVGLLGYCSLFRNRLA